jgi:8-oxo-dGTP pyrophosphatase MutT (NUDIX family)
MQKIIIASGPVIVENNKVLLDKDYKENIWKFCGGKIQRNESLIDTAKRRSNEELGIELEILEEKPFLLHTIKKTPEGDIDIILVHFLAKRIGEITSGEDIQKWDWLDIQNLEKENLAPNVLPALKHFGIIK